MKNQGKVRNPKGIPEDTPWSLPNCGVVSLAMICGISHAEAWELLKAKQRGAGRGWKGGTYDTQRKAVFRQLGVQYEIVLIPRLTLNQFLRSEYYQRSQTYELCVTRHAMCLHRHKLYDQSPRGRHGILAHESPYKRKIVSTVCRIVSGSPLRID
jgi:hypothetical protein